MQGLSLDFQICSIDLFVFFYVSTVLSFSLWLLKLGNQYLSFIFFFKIVLPILVPCIHMNFTISMSTCWKTLAEILIEVVWSVNKFGEYFHLTILDLLTYKHGMFFQQFFSMKKSCTSCVKFKYGTILDSIVNGVVFLISFLYCSLVMCRSKTEFFILILSPSYLLNLRVFLKIRFLRIFCIQDCISRSSENRSYFASFFPS